MSLTFSGTGTKFLPEPKLMAFKPGDKAAFQVVALTNTRLTSTRAAF